MMTAENDFIVAIELGSSKISGIVGKKKEGTWQILAYAQEKSAGCIRRGVIYNIEKTHQCINNIISKLEQTMKTKIVRAYVGIGGQSVRSYKCIVKRNLIASSFITNETIDSIREESTEIPYADCEVLENFPQEYKVDGSSVTEPVGVMGTNIEGEFLDIISRQQLKQNIDTVFANANVEVVDTPISPLHLADNVLTDAEKRSGCALVDLGAETTTLVIYKNNIVRYLVTIPLGCNNINKDLATLPVDDGETEDMKLKYCDVCPDPNEPVCEETYMTTDGRRIDVKNIKRVILDRTTEIIDNVCYQLVTSNYNNNTLLSGIVLTGGGCNMKNIADAFKNSTKIDKVRIAKKVNIAVVKTSNASGITIDSGRNNTLISLMVAGKEPCGGDEYGGNNIFEQQILDEEAENRRQEIQKLAEQELKAENAFNTVKDGIRSAYDKVQKQMAELESNGRSKDVRKKAREISTNIIGEVLGTKYKEAAKELEGKDKFKQTLREGAELSEKLNEAVQSLKEILKKKESENSAWGRFKNFLEDVTGEDN